MIKTGFTKIYYLSTTGIGDKGRQREQVFTYCTCTKESSSYMYYRCRIIRGHFVYSYLCAECYTTKRYEQVLQHTIRVCRTI